MPIPGRCTFAGFLMAVATAVTASQTPGPDIEAIDEIVGDAKIVVFGEDSHGMAAVHELVPRVFQRLVEKKGFRVFVFEAQWGLTEEFEDFFRSDRTELSSLEQYWLNGAFVSKATAENLVWIRDWNRAHPDDPIQIAGYQPEQPVKDFRALFALLERTNAAAVPALRHAVVPCRAADPAYKTDLDFVIANGKLASKSQPTYSHTERAACNAGIDAIEAELKKLGESPPGGIARAELEIARLHILSLRTYVNVLRRMIDDYFANPDAPISVQQQWSSEVYGRGDAARFLIYQKLAELRFPDKKVFHWMHNWHAARHASETGPLPGPGGVGIPKGTVSFGERLAGANGRSIVVFGNVVPCGDTCKEPDDSLEPAFASQFGQRAVWLDLRKERNKHDPLFSRAGSLLANHHGFGFTDVVLNRQYDALLYLPESAKVR